MSSLKPASGIGDVAQAAGVSVTTVSNVLNGRAERMSAETRSRVMQAIEQLGYTPSASARQLKTGRSRTVGLVVPTVANPFWGSVAHEIEKAALARGYNVMICNAERDPIAERQYAETLLSYGVKGVIFGSSPVSFDHLASLRSRGLVIAAFDWRGTDEDDAAACSVSVDNELGVRLAIQHLIGLGHRRIGAISGPIRTESRIKRLAGFRAAMRDAGLAIDEDLMWEGAAVSGYGDTEGAELGRAGMRELLTRREPPSAVFAMNDLYAWGAYAGARDMGLRIPDDVSIVGFDDIVLSELIQPPLTTVRQPTAAMSRSMIAGLLAQLEAQPTGAPAHLSAAPALIIRGSTAAPRLRAAQATTFREPKKTKRKP
ncbi:LacI family DNA-binding transcriptional regulator [Terrarubrum flagellatum]|uniref:LacI family DNA-binding transcriptional regulator n=1 Tax=Terrirubrum flagellatum TaxID=2895980 RepID=UPI0031450DA1